MSKKILLLLFLFWSSLEIMAQNAALGNWQTQLPYANATSVALSKNYLYGSSEYAVFSYNLEDGSIKKYTKSEGLSDVGISKIGYDTTTNTLIIAYTNSNIDILRNGKVTNLPFLLKANIIGNKQVNKIFTFNGIAWLATGFGMVELRLDKQEIGDTYYFSDGVNNFKVNDIWGNENQIFAATEKGLYTGSRDISVNLVNFKNWQLSQDKGIPVDKIKAVTGREGQVFAACGDIIYQLNDDEWTPYYSMPASKVLSLYKGKNRLIASQENSISLIPDNGTPENITGKFYISYPLEITESEDGRIFYADLYRSVLEYISSSNQVPIIPNGPGRVTCKGVDFLNNAAYIGSSPIGIGFQPTFNANGFYKQKDGFWETYTGSNLPAIEGAFDIAVVQALPSENLVLFGAHNKGLVEFNPDTKQVNFIQNFPNATSNMRLTAATKDDFNNVWFTNAYSTQSLICRKSGGEYIIFSSPLINNKLVQGIAIDDYQQIWMTIADGGIVVFNYGNSLDDTSDDRFITYNSVPGNGGLPTNSVTSIAADKKGQIWIGSILGVFYVPCPGAVFDRNCDAIQICVPRNDGTNFCDLLLETENINSIAIDAANRKWFGTSNGIFLQSEDGYKNIHYFSEDNSPLLSNRIRSLGIHPGNGDLYICTENGIITYRADAVSTYTNNEKPYAYPNPVRPDYNGPIAIKNLPLNSNVKITDIAGRLVFEGEALGAQFIWNGMDMKGNKVHTGIYYVLSTSSDKKEKVSTKIAFIQ
jgi:hypothetical protein